MEKEQKKLLLVAVSVGVFLLVTITAAIVIMTPKASIEETAFSSSRPYPVGITQTPVTDSPVIIHQQPAAVQETNVNIDCDEENIAIGVNRDDSGNLTINIPRPTTAAVPDTAEVPPASDSRPVATVAVRQQPAPARPAPTAQPAPAAAQTTQPAASRQTPAASTARQPAPARPAVNDYWVQTGAFSAKIRADDAKELLASKGITSIVENRQIDGRTWYRVRLGPYTSEREANYWLALVKSIDGFSESQVRQTVRQQ